MDINGKLISDITDVWITANAKQDGTRAYAEFVAKLTPPLAKKALGDDYADAIFSGTDNRSVGTDEDDGVEITHVFGGAKLNKKLVPQKHEISFARDKDDTAPIAVDEQPKITGVEYVDGEAAVNLVFRIEFDASNRKMRNMLWDNCNKTMLIGFNPINPALPLTFAVEGGNGGRRAAAGPAA